MFVVPADDRATATIQENGSPVNVGRACSRVIPDSPATIGCGEDLLLNPGRST